MFLTNDSMMRGAVMFLVNVSMELPAPCPAASPDTPLTEAGRLRDLEMTWSRVTHSREAVVHHSTLLCCVLDRGSWVSGVA